VANEWLKRGERAIQLHKIKDYREWTDAEEKTSDIKKIMCEKQQTFLNSVKIHDLYFSALTEN